MKELDSVQEIMDAGGENEEQKERQADLGAGPGGRPQALRRQEGTKQIRPQPSRCRDDDPPRHRDANPGQDFADFLAQRVLQPRP